MGLFTREQLIISPTVYVGVRSAAETAYMGVWCKIDNITSCEVQYVHPFEKCSCGEVETFV